MEIAPRREAFIVEISSRSAREGRIGFDVLLQIARIGVSL